MITIILLLLLALSPQSCCTTKPQRPASTPYITGDGFRAHADHIFDETDQTLQPGAITERSIVFVKTDMLDRFFTDIHPAITCHYILITHNSDAAIPGRWQSMIDDERIIAWFGQNVEGYSHQKLHPIPIGIANTYIPHGNPRIFQKAERLIGNYPKTYMLYMNFAQSTYPIERTLVYNLFRQKAFCYTDRSSLTLEQYLMQLIRSRFVLSPRGNGLDCHRTWEALLMGAIPIVKTSSLDPLFEDLPVLIINDWHDITEAFLTQAYQTLAQKNYNKHRLYISYWLNRIDQYTVRQ